MKKNVNIARDLLTFTLGVLLIIYSTINISISQAPDSVADIPNNYGKTYCLPIQSISPTSVEGETVIRKQTNNAYILVLLALIGGIYLVLSSFVGLYQILAHAEKLVTSKQFSKSFQQM